MAAPGVPSATRPAFPTPINGEDRSVNIEPDTRALLWYKFTAPSDGIYVFDCMLSSGNNPQTTMQWEAEENGYFEFRGYTQPWFRDGLMGYKYVDKGTSIIFNVSGYGGRSEGGGGFTSLRDIWENYENGFFSTEYPDFEEFKSLVLSFYTEQEFINQINESTGDWIEEPLSELVVRVRGPYEFNDWKTVSTETKTYNPLQYYLELSSSNQWGGSSSYHSSSYPYLGDQSPIVGATITAQTQWTRATWSESLRDCLWYHARRGRYLSIGSGPYAGICPVVEESPIWIGNLPSAIQVQPRVDLPSSMVGTSKIYLRRWTQVAGFQDWPSIIDGATEYNSGGAHVRYKIKKLEIAPDMLIGQFRGEAGTSWGANPGHVTWYGHTKETSAWGPSNTGYQVTNQNGPEAFADESELSFIYEDATTSNWIEIDKDMISAATLLEIRKGGSGIVFIGVIDEQMSDTFPARGFLGMVGATLACRVTVVSEYAIYENPLQQEVIEGAFDLTRCRFAQ